MSTEPTLATLHLGDFDRHGTTRALWEGRWIEVEHGIPGETVRAEVFGGKRPRARIVEVLDPSPDRIVPPCPYFRDWHCGGCQWQQIDYPGQVRRKEEQINAVMREAGVHVRVNAVHTLDDPWRYRSTAGIALGRSAGFRRQASLAIVPLDDCPISHPLIGRLMAALNTAIRDAAVPDLRGRVRVDVRVIGPPEGAALQGMVRPSEEGKGRDLEGMRSVARFLAGMDMMAGVSLLHPAGQVETVSGPLYAPADVAGHPVYLTAASFFQTNLRLLPDLIRRMLEVSVPLEGKAVADIYGGVGIFGLFMAEAGARVTVVESDRMAIEAGERTAQEWGAANLTFLPARAEEAAAALEERDVVIVDPPRSGLTPEFMEALIERSPPLLLYVSCLPHSLARDLLPLTAAGYTVESLEMFDFYPQTYHVEALAVLRLTPGPATFHGT